MVLIVVVVAAAVVGVDTVVLGFDGASGLAFSRVDGSCFEYVQPQTSTSMSNIHICVSPISHRIQSSLACARKDI